MLDIICTLLLLAVVAILAWVILSYVVGFGNLPWGHPVRKVYDVIDRGLQPILLPLRRVLPPVRMGGMALDLSPLVLIFGVGILRSIIC
jgi:YggT family protein